jgi:hypothetical protein
MSWQLSHQILSNSIKKYNMYKNITIEKATYTLLLIIGTATFTTLLLAFISLPHYFYY